MALTEVLRGWGVQSTLAHLSSAAEEDDTDNEDDHEESCDGKDDGRASVAGKTESNETVGQTKGHTGRAEDAMALHDLSRLSGASEEDMSSQTNTPGHEQETEDDETENLMRVSEIGFLYLC